jgi:hypothetical protein
MRAAFFTLLLMNITFFIWAHWVDVVSVRADVGAAEVPQLQLVPADPPSDSSAATHATMATQRAPSNCVSIGPFDDDNVSRQAAGILTAAGYHPQDRLTDTDVADGFWVYVPRLSSAAARRRALNTLRAANVRDAAVVSTPDQGERLSAGVFTDQSRAELRAALVRFAGLDAVVEPHQHRVSQHWLDVQLRDGEAAPTADLGAGSGATGAQLKLERCGGGG